MADTEIQPGASREERDQLHQDVRDERVARDTDTLIKTMPSPVTAVDSLGTERIITTTYGYDAPQVEPDPREVARLEAVRARLDNAKSERLKQLTDAPGALAPEAAPETLVKSTSPPVKGHHSAATGSDS